MTRPKMSLAERRAYWRDQKRRLRERAYAAAALAAEDARCPRRCGRGVCHGPLTSRVVDGVTVPYCARCARRDAGQCMHCGAPLPTGGRRRWYCALHRLLSTRQSKRRWNRTHHAVLNAARRRAYAAMSPAERDAYQARRRLYAVAASPTHPDRAAARAQLLATSPSRAAS